MKRCCMLWPMLCSLLVALPGCNHGDKNRDPIAADYTATTAREVPVTIQVLANDSQHFSIGLNAIASVRQPTLSLLAGDRRKRFRDGLPEARQRPCGLRSQDRLDCGPTCLERGEVRRVGGQGEESGAHGCNRLAYPCHLMGVEMIAPHHLPGPQLRHQHFLHKGQKGVSVHKAVDHHGRNYPYHAQRPNHRDMWPALHRLGTGSTLPPRGTAIGPGHGLVTAGFIDKDQSRGIKLWHRLAEGGPLSLHIGALLFCGVKRFFCASAEVAPRHGSSWQY